MNQHEITLEEMSGCHFDRINALLSMEMKTFAECFPDRIEDRIKCEELVHDCSDINKFHAGLRELFGVTDHCKCEICNGLL